MARRATSSSASGTTWTSYAAVACPMARRITYWPPVDVAPLGVAPESVACATPEESARQVPQAAESRASERAQVVVVDDLQRAEPVFLASSSSTS